MPTDKKRSKIAENETAGSFDGAHRNVMYERLMNAISEHRLQPGMIDAQQELLRLGLSENQIAAIGQDADATGGTAMPSIS